MHFASNVVRPPYEANSVYLQVTSGCSHNACRFCTYYKDAPFAVSPEREIVEDLEELASYGMAFPRIWLQGADPFLLSFSRLKRIANLIHKYLPFVKSIGGYGRIDSLKNKTVEQLKELKELGYSGIVFGVESGDDRILKFMNKGYKADEIVPQLSKMDAAGLNYEVIFLSGLGGKGYGLDHARKTAAVFNQLHPDRVLIAGLTIFPDTPPHAGRTERDIRGSHGRRTGAGTHGIPEGPQHRYPGGCYQRLHHHHHLRPGTGTEGKHDQPPPVHLRHLWRTGPPEPERLFGGDLVETEAEVEIEGDQ